MFNFFFQKKLKYKSKKNTFVPAGSLCFCFMLRIKIKTCFHLFFSWKNKRKTDFSKSSGTDKNTFSPWEAYVLIFIFFSKKTNRKHGFLTVRRARRRRFWIFLNKKKNTKSVVNKKQINYIICSFYKEFFFKKIL